MSNQTYKAIALLLHYAVFYVIKTIHSFRTERRKDIATQGNLYLQSLSNDKDFCNFTAHNMLPFLNVIWVCIGGKLIVPENIILILIYTSQTLKLIECFLFALKVLEC